MRKILIVVVAGIIFLMMALTSYADKPEPNPPAPQDPPITHIHVELE